MYFVILTSFFAKKKNPVLIYRSKTINAKKRLLKVPGQYAKDLNFSCTFAHAHNCVRNVLCCSKCHGYASIVLHKIQYSRTTKQKGRVKNEFFKSH